MTVTHERRDTVAASDLMRTAPFTLTRDDTEQGDGLTLDGYATVFNQATVIDSWEGRFKEIAQPGSWKRTLRATTPKLQFDHGMHPMIGSIPIGRVTSAAEEPAGPHIVGRLLDNWLVEPVRDAIAEGAIDGMSYRFGVVREEWRDKSGDLLKQDEVLALLWASYDLDEADLMTRYLKEVRVSEVGPVVWPAYAGTSVGVRSKVTIDLASIGTDPDQRRTLARAVFMADLAERGDLPQHDDDPQPTADSPGASPSDDARGSTDDAPGEHPSTPTLRDRIRTERELLQDALNTKGARRD